MLKKHTLHGMYLTFRNNEYYSLKKEPGNYAKRILSCALEFIVALKIQVKISLTSYQVQKYQDYY